MKKEDVVAGMLAYIAHLREVGRYSTAKSYLDALRSFKCFCGMEEIPYAYIDKREALALSGMAVEAGLYAQYGVHPICGESGISITWRWRLARFRISRICSRGCLLAWRASGRRRCLWIACVVDGGLRELSRRCGEPSCVFA